MFRVLSPRKSPSFLYILLMSIRFKIRITWCWSLIRLKYLIYIYICTHTDILYLYIHLYIVCFQKASQSGTITNMWKMFKIVLNSYTYIHTLPSRELTYPQKMPFWRWFFPKVGYVHSLEGIHCTTYFRRSSLLKEILPPQLGGNAPEALPDIVASCKTTRWCVLQKRSGKMSSANLGVQSWQ